MQLFEFVDAGGTPQVVFIPHLQEVLDARGVLAQPVLVADLARAARNVQIHPVRVQQVSLDEPLQAVTIQGQIYLVDGHHRLARAVLEGRRTVDVRILGEIETAAVLLSAAQVRAYGLAGRTPLPPDLQLEHATCLDSVRISPPLWRALLAQAGIPGHQARAFPSINLTPGCARPERLLWVFTPPLDAAMAARLVTLAARAGVTLLPACQDILAPGQP